MVKPLFGQHALTRMRARSEAASTSTAIVTTPSAEVEDGHGGWVPAGPPVVNVYPARIAPLGQRTAREQFLQDRFTDEELVLIVLPWDAVVTGDATLLFDGYHYEVVGLIPVTTYPIERKIICRQTGGAPVLHADVSVSFEAASAATFPEPVIIP